MGRKIEPYEGIARDHDVIPDTTSTQDDDRGHDKEETASKSSLFSYAAVYIQNNPSPFPTTSDQCSHF